MKTLPFEGWKNHRKTTIKNGVAFGTFSLKSSRQIEPLPFSLWLVVMSVVGFMIGFLLGGLFGLF